MGIANKDGEDPLPGEQPKVAVVYNLKKNVKSDVPDAEAEYDSIGTVKGICAALKRAGASTVMVDAAPDLVAHLMRAKVDLVFNIAEGAGGRGREAEVPAMLEMAGIPYTGSDPTTLCIALDKALTKRLLKTYRVRTPGYIVCSGADAKLDGVKYPVIVKPDAEGSSKGISDVSVAENEGELRAALEKNLAAYGGEMLVEEYIHGREFTVGVLGNGGDAKVFEPMEIVYKKKTQGDYCVYSYNVKQDYTKFVDYVCPAALNPSETRSMKQTALKIYNALRCRDFARMDFRMSPEGKIYFIEINPLPGLAPGYSDYPMLAEFCGVGYDALITAIYSAAVKRCGLVR
jgi:D-alanine-D-alanine ligase